jgi:hypothetical protein
MPYGAFALTVTAPPLGPLLCDALGVVLDGDEAGLLAAPDAPDAADAAAELMPAGTEVAFGPSSTSTWPAATAELGLAVTPV